MNVNFEGEGKSNVTQIKIFIVKPFSLCSENNDIKRD